MSCKQDFIEGQELWQGLFAALLTQRPRFIGFPSTITFAPKNEVLSLSYFEIIWSLSSYYNYRKRWGYIRQGKRWSYTKSASTYMREVIKIKEDILKWWHLVYLFGKRAPTFFLCRHLEEKCQSTRKRETTLVSLPPTTTHLRACILVSFEQIRKTQLSILAHFYLFCSFSDFAICATWLHPFIMRSMVSDKFDIWYSLWRFFFVHETWSRSWVAFVFVLRKSMENFVGAHRT